MEEEAGTAVVATDNYELGYKMGSYMKQFADEDTVIGIVGHVKGSSTALGREEGFRAGLGEAEKQVAEIVFCDSDTDKAYELTCGLLEKYPEIWNTGVKVTPANREKVYCTLRYFIKTLKLSTTLIFAFLVITSLQGSHLPGWFTPASLFLVFGGMAFWLIRLFLIRKG